MKFYPGVLYMLVAALLMPASFALAGDKPGIRQAPMVVTATKTGHKLENVPVETYVVTKEDIENSHAENLSELLDGIPGFNFSQQSNLPASMGYKNTVRGLNVESRYLLVLVDGQRTFTGYRSGGMASAGFSHNINVVPLELVDHVEVVKGPGSALYGSDALVGVLNIITKKPGTASLAGGSYGRYEVKGRDYMHLTPTDTSRSMKEAHALVSCKINDKVGAMVFVNQEENDGIHPEPYDVRRNNVTGKVDWQLTDKLDLSFGGEYAYWEEHDDAKTDVKKEKAPRLSAALDYEISPGHRLSFKTYTQKMDADFKDTYYGTQAAKVSYEDAEIQYTGLWADHHLVTLGGEFLRENLESSTVSDITNDTKSIFAQDEWALMNGSLVMVPGIRFDSNQAYGDEFNPKLSLMYRLGQDTTFRCSLGRSFKAPLASQAFAAPFNHYTMWIFSNPDLQPETSMTYQLGVEHYLPGRRVLLSATAYHIKVDDMIVQKSTGRIHQGLPVMSFANIESAKIQGLESMIRIIFSDRWDMNLGYTYTHARNDTTNQPLKDTPEHAVNGALNYKNQDLGLGFSLFGSYTDDQPNTVFVPGFSSETTDAFTTVGLTAWKSFSDRAKIKFAAGNIFNTKLEGSDTIHVTRSISLSAELKF